jgi:hypothetical protein
VPVVAVPIVIFNPVSFFLAILEHLTGCFETLADCDSPAEPLKVNDQTFSLLCVSGDSNNCDSNR